MKAVALDDNTAEALAALGFEKKCYERDQSAAENEYRRAIATNPNYAHSPPLVCDLLLRGSRDQGDWWSGHREAIFKLPKKAIDGNLPGFAPFCTAGEIEGLHKLNKRMAPQVGLESA